jgi:hypothetical protein
MMHCVQLAHVASRLDSNHRWHLVAMLDLELQETVPLFARVPRVRESIMLRDAHLQLRSLALQFAPNYFTVAHDGVVDCVRDRSAILPDG